MDTSEEAQLERINDQEEKLIKWVGQVADNPGIVEVRRSSKRRMVSTK